MPIWEGYYINLCELRSLSTYMPFWNITHCGHIFLNLLGELAYGTRRPHMLCEALIERR